MYDEAFYSEPFVTYSIFRLLLPFSIEPYVTLAYSLLEANSEPYEISVMENFIQNLV